MQSYQRFQHIVHTVFNTSGTNGPRAETGAFLPSATAWLCATSEIHFIPPCFYIHTFPGSLWTTTISNSSISDHLSSRFPTSRTNGLRLLSQAKVGTHSAFGEESHTAAHTAKHGPSLPRPQHGLVLPAKSPPKEQPEEADARLWRVSASSGVAAPLGCVIFSVSVEIYGFTPRTQGFLCVRGGGGITTPGARCVLPKFSAPACQSGLFAVF